MRENLLRIISTHHDMLISSRISRALSRGKISTYHDVLI